MILFFLKELIKPAFFAFRLAKSRRQLINEYPTIKLLGKFNVINSNFGKYNRLCSCVIKNSSLGDYSIGPDVSIGLGSHPSRDFISIHPVFYSKEKQVSITFSDKNYFEEYENTIIGNDVWIGANVIINGGVVIEDGCIIAAG